MKDSMSWAMETARVHYSKTSQHSVVGKELIRLVIAASREEFCLSKRV